MEEIWKFIPGLSEKYSASNLGRIRRNSYSVDSYRDGKVVTWNFMPKFLIGNAVSPKGYLRVNLERKVYLVHRLIALAFLDNVNNKPQINHKDGNKLNNRVINLEWVTNQENRDHAVCHNLHPNRSNGYFKISETEVQDILHLCEIGVAQKVIACIYKVTQQTISKLRIKYSDQSRWSNARI